MAKVKVYNENKHNVGIRLENGTQRNIAPGSFALLNEDDVAYLMSISTLFSNHHLTLRDEKAIEELGVTKEEVSFDTDEEILTKLKKSSLPVLKKYLASITEPHLRQRVIALVKENTDLSAAKVKAIEDAFNTEIEL